MLSLKETILQAGDIAKKYFGQVTPSVKNNDTFVTQGDLEVQAFLVEYLQATFPDDGIIAEESNVSQPPLSGKRTWVIDPIDGTSSFVRGFPTWGIAVGLIDADQAVEGMFYMPMTGDFFEATSEGVVMKNGQAMKGRELPNHRKESVLLVDSKFHKMFLMAPDYQGKIRSLGSASAHMCYVATGSADAVLLPALPIWDLAMGFAILGKTEYSIKYFDGAPVSLATLVRDQKAPKPILCGRPEMITRVQEACIIK